MAGTEAARKRSWLVALFSVLVLLASACGGGDDEILEDVGAEPGDPEPAEPDEPEEPEDADEPADEPAEPDEPEDEEEPAEGEGEGEDTAAGDIPAPERASAPASEPPQELVDAACEEGEVVIYESSPGEAVLQVLQAFQEDYPCIEVTDHVRLAGPEVGVRIIQESEAGVPTADAGFTGPDTGADLDERGLLAHEDWAALGVPEELAPVPYGVATVAGIYGVMYNTDLVSEEDAPQTWDDLLDPQWEGQIAAWSRPTPFVGMVPSMGGDAVIEYVEALAEQDVTLYDDFPHIPQAVGAGEYAIGIGHHHTATPAIEEGAPLQFAITDPLPMTILHGYVPENAENPNAGKLFVVWINGERGSQELEAATGRGNPLIPGTAAAELAQDVEIGTFPITHVEELTEWVGRLGEIWQ